MEDDAEMLTGQAANISFRVSAEEEDFVNECAREAMRCLISNWPKLEPTVSRMWDDELRDNRGIPYTAQTIIASTAYSYAEAMNEERKRRQR